MQDPSIETGTSEGTSRVEELAPHMFEREAYHYEPTDPSAEPTLVEVARQARSIRRFWVQRAQDVLRFLESTDDWIDNEVA